MNKQFKVKIPKGTLIDINGESFLLKKSIYAHSDGERIILTGDQITTDLLTVERRHMTPSTIPRITGKPMNKENDLSDIAKTIVENKIGSEKLQKNALKYLEQLFESVVDYEEEKPQTIPKAPRTKYGDKVPPASDD